jgi:hypothetical protein
MMTTAVAALCLATTLAACGDAAVRSAETQPTQQTQQSQQSRASRTYDGPLHVEPADARHPRAGAAGNVVDCDTWGAGGTTGEATYSEGATAGSPDDALEVARGEGAFGGVQEGLTVAKEEDDRVLYVVEVGGVAKQAVIVRDGPATEGAGGPGWYVESWAHCDYAELPRSFADSIGLQIWSRADGRPAPTTAIESWTGAEHCDWQSMTFLFLGKAQYVRDPHPELDDFFAEEYDAHAALPDDAVDTGYERGGDHLWLSTDKRRAYVGTEADVEVWPRTVQPLGCA